MEIWIHPGHQEELEQRGDVSAYLRTNNIGHPDFVRIKPDPEALALLRRAVEHLEWSSEPGGATWKAIRAYLAAHEQPAGEQP